MGGHFSIGMLTRTSLLTHPLERPSTAEQMPKHHRSAGRKFALWKDKDELFRDLVLSSDGAQMPVHLLTRLT